ncbi:hypothetical protein ACJJIH_00005 [Microbulbifer sp. ANSA004]|uniref:hypothetical protein n=1 Tax=Microbulbifer sp. ANSA004 TaxID=3243361 RepID=UPI0040435017
MRRIEKDPRKGKPQILSTYLLTPYKGGISAIYIYIKKLSSQKKMIKKRITSGKVTIDTLNPSPELKLLMGLWAN